MLASIDKTAQFVYIDALFMGGPLAQLAEHWPFKPRVAGSNPARLTMNKWGRHRLVWPRTLVFQAGNTGPNPVGDAIFL